MSLSILTSDGSRDSVLARAGWTPPPEVPTVTALPQRVDLVFVQGDDLWLRLIVTGGNGQPLDLGESTAQSQIRPDFDSDVLAEFDTSVDGNHIDLDLPHTQTAELNPGWGVWDVQVTVDNRITTLVSGLVTITPEVTR